MAQGTQTHILRQMAGLQGSGEHENPLTTSRAMRLLLAKVAQDHAGLALSVSSISETAADLDPALDDLPDGLMLVRLDRGDLPVGLIALDPDLRAAVLEIATTGTLNPHAAAARAPTATDHFLCQPLLASFVAAFPEAVQGTPLQDWVTGAAVGAMIADTRRAALLLAECSYRTIQMTVQLAQTDRQGLLVLMLPIPKAAPEDSLPLPEKPDWADSLASRIGGSCAILDAHLHRFSLPLSALRALAVDTVLPLHGCSVSSVRLKTLDGRTVASARLGQSAGKRAVRIETPPALDMHDLPTARAAAAPMVAFSQVAEGADQLPVSSADRLAPAPRPDEARGFDPAEDVAGDLTQGAEDGFAFDAGGPDPA
ncbi:FliM/FliN family flagellar motor C-terminal domain-containing protein [Yoonia sp.]|uniref:FliM/FliN family flagellar motor C-terminal domain-containing protein n=1 Tax=Yoonia sp. TaxID=2212373 RepID=UPI002FD9A171